MKKITIILTVCLLFMTQSIGTAFAQEGPNQGVIITDSEPSNLNIKVDTNALSYTPPWEASGYFAPQATKPPTKTATLPYSGSGTISADHDAIYSAKAWKPNSNGKLKIEGSMDHQGLLDRYYCTVYLYDLDSSYSYTVYNDSSTTSGDFSWSKTVSGLNVNHRYYLLIMRAKVSIESDVEFTIS